MKAFLKTLFGDTWNLGGVALMVAVAAALTGAGRPGWAVFAMPICGLAVVALLTRH